MPLLLNACPSFSERWRAHCADDDERLLYLDLAEFARHLVELHRLGKAEEFPAVFAVIEQMHLDGDAYVKNAATVGMLEAIQNVAEHSGVDPEDFAAYLLPESARWWRQLNDFWSGKIPYVGATRAQE